MFSRILLATDFSENARQAYAWAAELARVHGGTLVLVHALESDVVNPGTVYGGPFLPEGVDYQALLAEFKQSASGALEAAKGELEEKGAGQVETHLIDGGKAWRVIIDAAKELNCSIIVLATHGRGGLAHLLLGSTAERVVRGAHVPVLTVHEGDRMS